MMNHAPHVRFVKEPGTSAPPAQMSHSLKIDASFVNQLERRGQESEIVRTILAIGRNLSKTVVAEGVETAAQVQELKALDCQYGQGYYWSRPVDAQDVPALLHSWNSRPGSNAAAGPAS